MRPKASEVDRMERRVDVSQKWLHLLEAAEAALALLGDVHRADPEEFCRVRDYLAGSIAALKDRR